jgi:integrase
MDRNTITDTEALHLHERYLLAAGLAPDTTVKNRMWTLRRLADDLDPYAAHPRTLLEATSEELASWQASLAHLNPKSISVYLQHTRLFYSWAVRPMRLLDESPASDLAVPIVRKRKPRPIPEDDYAFALDACVDRRTKVWLKLGGYAGLRSIDISDLDKDDLIRNKQVDWLRVRGKGDHEDLVAIPADLADDLEPYTIGRRGAMFVRDDGRRCDRRYIRRKVNNYLQSIGVPYTFHQARHRYGTHLYAITRDIRYCQRQLRHRTVESTELYVDTPTEHDAKAIAALDAELAQRRRRGA